MERTVDISWQKIFDDCKLNSHDFTKSPYMIDAKKIKEICQDFTTTAAKEVRILCKQDSREDRPKVFEKNNLFFQKIKFLLVFLYTVAIVYKGNRVVL